MNNKTKFQYGYPIIMAVSLGLFTLSSLFLPVVSYAAAEKTAVKKQINETQQPKQQGQITLNFSDADIGTVIEAVSKFTGQNFIVDPRVKGKVTIISQRPMNADQVYQVFLSVLKVHGFAAIPGR
jgi:type II secretory pathway component GspD/PulD (secretin)